MNARLALSIALLALVALLTGCPDDWGIGGRNDQAMAKDIQVRLHQQCAVGEHPKEDCKPGQQCNSCVPNK